jgi:hypothetical protein
MPYINRFNVTCLKSPLPSMFSLSSQNYETTDIFPHYSFAQNRMHAVCSLEIMWYATFPYCLLPSNNINLRFHYVFFVTWFVFIIDCPQRYRVRKVQWLKWFSRPNSCWKLNANVEDLRVWPFFSIWLCCDCSDLMNEIACLYKSIWWSGMKVHTCNPST